MEVALLYQQLMERAAEDLDKGLDAVRERHHAEATAQTPARFTGSQDVPALLSAYATDNFCNLGLALRARKLRLTGDPPRRFPPRHSPSQVHRTCQAASRSSVAAEGELTTGRKPVNVLSSTFYGA